jgi:hypothetical protein
MEQTPQQKKKSEIEEFGGLFGITLVITLFIAGGIYFIYMQQQQMQHDKQLLEEQTNS